MFFPEKSHVQELQHVHLDWHETLTFVVVCDVYIDRLDGIGRQLFCLSLTRTHVCFNYLHCLLLLPLVNLTLPRIATSLCASSPPFFFPPLHFLIYIAQFQLK